MHVCLFDIDGTLLLSGGAGKAAMERALAVEFAVDARSDGIPFSGRTDRAIARDLFRLHGVADTPRNWQQFVAAYLRELPDCLASHPGRVLPGVAELLTQLRAREDVAVGLLTGNLQEGARLKLTHYGLWDHFAFGGFGDVHEDRDHVARDALAAVRQGLGREPAVIWVIGDTPLDVRCGRSIGACVVAVATGWHSAADLLREQPDLLLRDLSDVAPLYRHWGWSTIQDPTATPRSD